jgi:hypothetical protein
VKTQYLVGRYKLGFKYVRLIVDTTTANGSVDLVPDDKETTKIVIGIDSPWSESLSVFLHEVYEGTLIDLHTRYKARPSYSDESSDFIFVVSHNQLSEAHERVGVFLAESLPDFTKAYKKYSSFKETNE